MPNFDEIVNPKEKAKKKLNAVKIGAATTVCASWLQLKFRLVPAYIHLIFVYLILLCSAF